MVERYGPILLWILALGFVFGALMTAIRGKQPWRASLTAGVLFGCVLALAIYFDRQREPVFGVSDYLFVVLPPTILTLVMVALMRAKCAMTKVALLSMTWVTWTVLAIAAYSVWPSIMRRF